MKKIYAYNTEYFMSNERTHRELLQSMKDVRERKNLITYTPAQWDRYVKETLAKIKLILSNPF